MSELGRDELWHKDQDTLVKACIENKSLQRQHNKGVFRPNPPQPKGLIEIEGRSQEAPYFVVQNGVALHKIGVSQAVSWLIGVMTSGKRSLLTKMLMHAVLTI